MSNCKHDWRDYHKMVKLNEYYSSKQYMVIYFYCRKCLTNKKTTVKL